MKWAVLAALCLLLTCPALATDQRAVRATNDLALLRRALDEYFKIYGSYPPTNDASSIAYEYEYSEPGGQTPWFRDIFLPAHDDPGNPATFFADTDSRAGWPQPANPGWHLNYRYGLFAYLYPRARTGQRHWYDADTARDSAAKLAWSRLLREMTFGSALVAHPSPPGIGGYAPFTNSVLTILDPWGREYNFSAPPPYTNCTIRSPGGDGVFGTSDDIMCQSSGVSLRFTQSAEARQIALTGLSNAIADIDASLASNHLVYPNWDALASGPTGDPTTLFEGDATGFIPSSLAAPASTATPRWQTVGTTSNGIRSQYAYLAINCSGLLDANVAGGSNRWAGADPAEIDIARSPDVLDAAIFLNLRQIRDRRYETLPEFHTQQAGEGLQPTHPPADFMIGSRFPNGIFDGSAVQTNATFIGGTVNELASNRTAIIQALLQAGILETEASSVYTSLLDYVDTDSVPRDLASPTTEAVPMINEVVVHGGVGFNTGQIRSGSLVMVEWLYPFIRPSPNTYELHTQIRVTLRNINASTSVSCSATNVMWAGYNPGLDTLKYHVVTIQGPLAAFAGNAGDSVQVQIEVRAQVKLTGGSIVDAVPFPTNGPPLTFTSPVMTVPPNGFIEFSTGLETVDPRFNWDASPNSMWFDPADEGMEDSLWTTNHFAQVWLGFGADDPTIDQGLDMYVSDRGFLLSPGELGNLPRGFTDLGDFAWFKTIRLFEHPGASSARRDDVLRYFTTQPAATRCGLVNPNTRNTNVLAAVFCNTPVGHPGSSIAITSAETAAIVSAIVAEGARGYTNMHDLGRLDWRAMLPTHTDLERESILSHNCQLLSTRQNLFTIILRGSLFSPSPGIAAEHENTGISLANQRAAAVVWRDPFPNSEGKHRSEIISLQWMEDTPNYLNAPDAIDQIAMDLSGAICDPLLSGQFIHGGQPRLLFFALGSTPSQATRAARRITYQLIGSNLIREVDGLDSGGPYPILAWPQLITLVASNVTRLAFFTSDGLDHHTDLPEWIEVQMEIANQAKATRRIWLGPNRTADTEWDVSTQYWLDIAPSANGHIATTSGWYNAGSPLTIGATPSNGYVFAHWSGDIYDQDNPMPLVMDRPYRIEASIMPEPLHRFEWGNVTSTETVGIPFPVSITARGASGYALPAFTGPASISAWSNIEQTNVMVREHRYSWSPFLYTTYHDNRVQSIYLTNEIPGMCSITSLTFMVSSLPSTILQNWTIRMKHTSLGSFPSSPSWESTGWTTVYQTNEAILEYGWRTFLFRTPFEYNGTNNLMVDFSFNNDLKGAFDGTSGWDDSVDHRCIGAVSDSTNGDPLDWEGGINPVPFKLWGIPAIRLAVLRKQPLPMTPVFSGSFGYPSPGTWTGTVAILEDSTNICLRADDPVTGAYGYSDPFGVAGKDYGDAPETLYPTQVASDGAWHAIRPGYHLGALIDGEWDGFQSPDSLGDDLNAHNDEDGVIFAGPLVIGYRAWISIIAATGGYINAWIDHNQDGWNNGTEDHVFSDVLLSPGTNLLSMVVPTSAIPSTTSARFRFSTSTNLTFHGAAPDGEVEDYEVAILNLDTDRDGMLDQWETDYFGDLSRDGTGDLDGDGSTDFSEFIAATSPTNALDLFHIARFEWIPALDAAALSWHSESNRTYTVSMLTNWLSAWTNIVETGGNGQDRSYTNSGSPRDKAFFRLAVRHDWIP